MNRTQTHSNSIDFFQALDFVVNTGFITEKEVWQEVKACRLQEIEGTDEKQFMPFTEKLDLIQRKGREAKHLNRKDITPFALKGIAYLYSKINRGFFVNANDTHFGQRHRRVTARKANGGNAYIEGRLSEFFKKKYNERFYGVRDKNGDWNQRQHKLSINTGPFFMVIDKNSPHKSECFISKRKAGSGSNIGSIGYIRLRSFEHDSVVKDYCEKDDVCKTRQFLTIYGWGDYWLNIALTKSFTDCLDEGIAFVEQCIVRKAVLLEAECSDVYKYWKATYYKKYVSHDGYRGWKEVDGYIGRYASDDQAHAPISLRCSPSLSGVKKKIENRTVATGVSALLNGLASQ